MMASIAETPKGVFDKRKGVDMKYQIQTKPTIDDKWHPFATADDFVIASCIMETYQKKFESFYFRILDTLTKEVRYETMV
jgi:hypothetical protein